MLAANQLKRLIIFISDIQRITGKSERSCRNLMEKAKKHHQKQKHQPLTIPEFCDYMGLSLMDVNLILFH